MHILGEKMCIEWPGLHTELFYAGYIIKNVTRCIGMPEQQGIIIGRHIARQSMITQHNNWDKNVSTGFCSGSCCWTSNHSQGALPYLDHHMYHLHFSWVFYCWVQGFRNRNYYAAFLKLGVYPILVHPPE